jgi:hypothetical protein
MSNPRIRPGSDEEWEDLLGQLRVQAKAQPRPFFYARVQARLTAERHAGSSWLLGWVRRPAYLALLGALILAVSGDGAALPPVASGNQYNAHQLGQPASLLAH